MTNGMCEGCKLLQLLTEAKLISYLKNLCPVFIWMEGTRVDRKSIYKLSNSQKKLKLCYCK